VPLHAGDALIVQVWTEECCRVLTAGIPGDFNIVQPTHDQTIPDDEDIVVDWSASDGVNYYYVRLEVETGGTVETLYETEVSADTLTHTIPASATEVPDGNAYVVVGAMKGSGDRLPGYNSEIEDWLTAGQGFWGQNEAEVRIQLTD
jgi:hypothetical protein